MIDHMTFRVSKIAQTKAFYAAALSPLGYQVAYEGFHGCNVLGFAARTEHDPEKIDTWFVDGPSPYGGHPVTIGCHLCWRAPSRDAVDAFYAAAIAAGGQDNGPPGLRPQYHLDYYGAFVIDPDGNNIEAVCHLPA
ncbi:VOC family protein [Limnohabitans sp.]|uniref:VOC family protein n=1 Tax=Limnohabitans sp. TaxID=1907725 RepID=UPI003BAE1772